MASRRPFLQRAAAVLAAAALVFGSGGHWLLLQSVAWIGMIATYSQDRPLTQAVADTLDGAHPCDLCKAVAKGQQRESGEDRGPAGAPAKGIKKLTASIADVIAVPSRADAFMLLAHPEGRVAQRRAESPPVPPPRGA